MCVLSLVLVLALVLMVYGWFVVDVAFAVAGGAAVAVIGCWLLVLVVGCGRLLFFVVSVV